MSYHPIAFVFEKNNLINVFFVRLSQACSIVLDSLIPDDQVDAMAAAYKSALGLTG